VHSFHNIDLPKRFDNYFSDIASVQKYQTKLTFLQKPDLPRMKTSLGQLLLKCIGPKIWFDTNENLKSLSLVHLENIKEPPGILTTFLLIFIQGISRLDIPVFVSCACHFYVIMF